MSKNIDNMETKIRLQNIAVVNGYCSISLPPSLPHTTHLDRTETPHMTVNPVTGAVLGKVIKERH